MTKKPSVRQHLTPSMPSYIKQLIILYFNVRGTTHTSFDVFCKMLCSMCHGRPFLANMLLAILRLLQSDRSLSRGLQTFLSEDHKVTTQQLKGQTYYIMWWVLGYVTFYQFNKCW